MSTTLEIIQGLAQAAARAYDGAHVADYNDDGLWSNNDPFISIGDQTETSLCWWF